MPVHDFKPGDDVVCIDPDGSLGHWLVGKVYKVLDPYRYPAFPAEEYVQVTSERSDWAVWRVDKFVRANGPW